MGSVSSKASSVVNINMAKNKDTLAEAEQFCTFRDWNFTKDQSNITSWTGVSKIDVRKNFFSQRVPRYWNSLPETTR